MVGEGAIRGEGLHVDGMGGNHDIHPFLVAVDENGEIFLILARLAADPSVVVAAEHHVDAGPLQNRVEVRGIPDLAVPASLVIKGRAVDDTHLDGSGGESGVLDGLLQPFDLTVAVAVEVRRAGVFVAVVGLVFARIEDDEGGRALAETVEEL